MIVPSLDVRTSFVAVSLLAGTIAMLVVGARTSPNVALHKSVAASSSAYGTVPEGAVDGIFYGELGFHSAVEPSPWLAVDLGAPHVIDRIEVFGRSDSCFDQSVPLAAEISDDGTIYRSVGERTDPIEPYDPWVLDLPPPTVARFVRLRTLRESVLVVSDVRVYGKPAPR